ncbi:MAG: hypothetical protein JST00_16435 [Deltaproteobacteria bacterium]|nr:hypothetical protein [Deltaproteobacteria bacterium]
MSRTHSLPSLVALLLAALSAGCDKDKPAATTTSASSASAAASGASSAASASASGAAASASGATAAASASGAPAASGSAAAGARAAGSGAAVSFGKEAGLSTPESVLFDEAADVYLVSNINGSPLEADGNGFISKLTPDGKVESLKWIEGGKNKVTLNAPKGLAIVGDVLYVADLDTVRMFDRKTGAPAGEVKIAGATFLNDLTVGTDGKVLVSDSGLKGGAKGFEPSGTDAVYVIDKAKKVTPLAKSKDLGGPNGLLAIGEKTWVVTFGSGEMYSLDTKGKKSDVAKLPKGQLDGILALPNGDVLVSSWEGSVVYRGKPGAEMKAIVEDVKSPADIGYDKKRNRVLVPLFMENEVRAYELK